jgi:hypothetical protein
VSNRAQTTHRIPRGYDGTVVCYVRDDAGKQDLAGQTLAVTLRSYQRNCTVADVDATQDEVGLVTFPVSDSLIDSKLPETLYRFDVAANGVPVYEAILEIV